MIKISKIDAFIKNNIRSFRAKAIPLSLNENSIAVGDTLIHKHKDKIVLNDPKNDQTLTMYHTLSAILLAKYIDNGVRPNTRIWNTIIDFDRKIGKYKSDTEFYTKRLKETNNEVKSELYSNRIDHCNKEMDYYVAELNRLNKWRY